MKSESEMIADIVSEIREKAAHFEKNSELMVSENAIALFILPYADRIEAACERERESARAYWTKKCRDTIAEHDRYCSPVGNAAATRKALEMARDALKSAEKYVYSDPPNGGAIGWDDVWPSEWHNALEAVELALSAPARNCDLPNHEERFTEFCSRYLSCSTCPHSGRGELRCTGKWLLATAAERKGADNGR